MNNTKQLLRTLICTLSTLKALLSQSNTYALYTNVCSRGFDQQTFEHNTMKNHLSQMIVHRRKLRNARTFVYISVVHLTCVRLRSEVVNGRYFLMYANRTRTSTQVRTKKRREIIYVCYRIALINTMILDRIIVSWKYCLTFCTIPNFISRRNRSKLKYIKTCTILHIRDWERGEFILKHTVWWHWG